MADNHLDALRQILANHLAEIVADLKTTVDKFDSTFKLHANPTKEPVPTHLAFDPDVRHHVDALRKSIRKHYTPEYFFARLNTRIHIQVITGWDRYSNAVTVDSVSFDPDQDRQTVTLESLHDEGDENYDQINIDYKDGQVDLVTVENYDGTSWVTQFATRATEAAPINLSVIPL